MSKHNTALIKKLLLKKDFKAIKTKLTRWQIQDIAEFITTLSESETLLIFRTLPHSISADVFSHLDTKSQEQLVKSFTNKEAKEILADLSPDDRAHVLEELPGIVTRRLFKLLNPADLAETKTLLGYAPESVGRIMTPDYVFVYEDMTVKEAIERIKIRGKDSETLNRIYITDSAKKLIDSIKLRTLILADPKATIASLLTYNPIQLTANQDREEAVKAMQKYDLTAIPVVDTKGILIGIVTFDDLVDVAQEEATEDIHKIGSVSPLKASYTDSSILTLFQKRIYWLSLLIVLGLLSAGIISFYEELLAEVIILAIFIPLLIGSAGNIGAQSSTLIVRALATDDIKIGEWFKVLCKEVVIGFIIGVTLGLVISLIGFYKGGIYLALVIGFAMLATVLAANIVGAMIPFILSISKIDPAIASAPLITTIMDVLGLVIYFSIALFFLSVFGM